MLKKILVILCLFFLINPVFSTDTTGGRTFIPKTYSAVEIASFVKQGNDNLRLYENATDKILKEKYLKEALRNFYVAVRLDFNNIDAHIGLGKVYDDMNNDKYAKMEFNSAYNIDNKNPKLNYRYGDYYYKRKQLSMAEHYFERAYNYGYSKNYDLNIKMAQGYIKLAQPQKAEQHMKIAKELEKSMKKQQTKLAVNSVIKQAGNVSINTNNSNANKQTVQVKTSAKIVKHENASKEKFDITKSTGQKREFVPNKTFKPNKNVNYIKFEDFVLNAFKIKMIEDVDKQKPMYYLFIK